jgi:hypothetical protein
MIAMAAVFFLYAVVSATIAPWWAVVLLVLAWVALFALCCSWWSTHPRRISVVAVAAVVLWFAVLAGGAAWLDWSA